MRSAVIHFGCRLNQFESDGLKANLADHGQTLTDNLQDADYIIINTCTVTNKADYKNRATIRRAHRLNPQAKIVVTGCYATTDADEIRSLPGVYRVVANEQKHRIAAMLSGQEEKSAQQNRFFFSANHAFKSRATLKIQDGCNKSCSYCKIPQARGRGVSRDFADTISSARELVNAGFGEIVLTGVNIGWYENHGKNFCTLLESLLELPGNFHLRISSIEPGDVTERFAEFYRHPKMARFLHIPLQSGSRHVLRMMRRGYTPENFLRRIEYVRKICPEIHVGTDVIVGFPAEGEAEFQETLNFCRAADFANIHIFPFSKRRNTPIVEWLERKKQRATESNPLSAAHKTRSLAEIHGAVMRQRIADLSRLKNTMAESYARRVSGLKFFAIAERIESGSVHFLTENYLRGALTAADYPNLQRGSRFEVIWSPHAAMV